MQHKYFPACPVNGPIEPPVPFGYGSCKAVPKKCSECRHLFEGECLRAIEEVGGYLHVDHGPCGVEGSTDPVIFEDEFLKSKVEVPRKCTSCPFLAYDRIYAFYCSKDEDKWGRHQGGLDWGFWQPNCLYMELPAPKVTTRALVLHLNNNDFIAFVREYRRANSNISIAEAKSDFAHYREIIEKQNFTV